MAAMARRRLVIASIETVDGDRCVDIFRRSDGSFGFETYRRDAEDGRGWFPIGGFEAMSYDTEDEARAAARTNAPWIAWHEVNEQMRAR
jgi:hypothetical protein